MHHVLPRAIFNQGKVTRNISINLNKSQHEISQGSQQLLQYEYLNPTVQVVYVIDDYKALTDMMESKDKDTDNDIKWA